MTRLEIIDLICQRHPSYGVEKGWAEYTGGMKDSGQWFVRKMLDVPDEQLLAFLEELITIEKRPPRLYTDEERADMQIKHEVVVDGKTYWYSEFERKEMERFNKEFTTNVVLRMKPSSDK